MNELTGPHVVIVLGIREGRGFEFLSQPLWVEASLKGHRIESDAVEPSSTPSICTELVWETEKKEVRKLRSSHVPLRVDCYTLDARQQKEKLGFILLSLRSAAAISGECAGSLESKWHRLVSVPNEYRMHKPELALTLTVRDRVCTPREIMDVEQPFGVSQEPTVIPIIYLEEGYIQIGNDNEYNQKFILSFFIKVAHNLDTVLHQDIVFTSHSEKFFLTLSVLGLTINTKYFGKNLHEPVVLNERIVFKLLTNLEVFQLFLQEFKSVPLHFHHGQKVIATAKIHLEHFLRNNELEFGKSCTLEQCSEFIAKDVDAKCNKAHSRIPSVITETMLEIQSQTPKSPISPKNRSPSLEATIDSDESIQGHRNAYGDQASTRKRNNNLSPSSMEDAAVQTTSRESPRIHKTSAVLHKKKSVEFSVPPLCWTHDVGPYLLYELLITFKNITWRKNLDLNAFQFKFHHPKAQQALVINCDVEEILPMEVMLLEDVCCIMHFLSTEDNIRNVVAMYPPTVSLQKCDDKNIADDFTVYTKILLNDIVDNCDYFAVLTSLNTVEDLCDLQIEIQIKSLTDHKMEYEDSEFNLEPVVIDDWLAVKTIKDLEEWKDKQEILFKDNLKQTECKRLELLQNEWNQKRNELESKLQKGMEKCKLLSEQLTKSAQEVKIKKRSLDQKLLTSPKSREKIEIKVTQMLEEEMNKNIERIEAEKQKLLVRIDQLKKEKQALEDQMREKESQLEEMRKTTLTKEQTANLLQELRHLEEKFQQAQLEKTFFKQQWHATLKEVHALKAEDQRQMRQEIQRQKEELSHFDLTGRYEPEEASPEVDSSEEEADEEEEKRSLNSTEDFERRMDGILETLKMNENANFEMDNFEVTSLASNSFGNFNSLGSQVLEKIEETDELNIE